MNKLTIQPLHDRVVVKQNEVEQKTESGLIFLATDNLVKPNTGVVMAVGNGTKEKPVNVKIGDNIMFESYVNQGINIEEIDYLIMRDVDIISIIN